MDRAPLQVHRQVGRRIQVRAVTDRAVVGQAAQPVLPPRLAGRCRPGRRQGERFGAVRVSGNRAGLQVPAPLDAIWPTGRRPPPVRHPRPVEGGEDPEGRAGAGADPPGRHRVGRAGRYQRGRTQRRLDLVVAAAAVRSVVGADVHRAGAGLRGHRRHDVGRPPGTHHEPPAALGQFGVQCPQCAQEPGDAGGAGRSQQGIVEHEQWQDGTVVGGSEQRGMVVQAQVPA